MTRLVTPYTRKEGVQRLGDLPEFQAIAKSRQLKSQTDSSEIPESHVAALMAERPAFLPVPEGYGIIKEYDTLRVLKKDDDTSAAIQFADTHRPSRAEKDKLEALGQPEHVKFTYQPRMKIWTREEYHFPEANINDAKGMGAALDKGRQGISR